MADNPATPPAGDDATAAPRPQRPRPQYGELAPEGWSWTPPPGANPHAGSDITGSSQRAESTHPHGAARQQPPVPAPPLVPVGRTGSKKALPTWDRPVTYGLLLLGLVGTFMTVGILQAVPDAVQMLYTQEGLGTYQAAAVVPELITAGIIAVWAVWVLTIGFTVLLLTRHRRAFYLPIIGGFVSFVVVFVFLSIILTTDPTLLQFYSRP
ncbi:DUF6264 family protein [Glaciibacter psychrotolerans]|uniref:Uncharacterized protein n=1 Tax=Glaciibacter psychrotolerans TaxID=670054 RepID=A0A7Z0EDT7_9MICO|nr:DUF6264 family protein [Leifsonia psychrotolerans]NYJ19826.1 hypothetical protein [Leifsonia psychrotolerans]